MAQDRISEYILSLGADDTDLRSMMAGVKNRFKSDIAELERTTKNVELFGAITDNLPKVQQAIDKAKSAIVDLNKQIEAAKAAGKPYDDLQQQLTAAEKALASATKEFGRQNTEVNALQEKLKAAGIDTSNLAGAQEKLAKAVQEANTAATQQAAKDLLGFKSIGDVTPKIKELQAAFETLKSSGSLTAKELATAQDLFKAKVNEARDSVTRQTTEGKSGFDLLGVTIGGVTAGVAGLAVGAQQALQKIVEFIGEAIASARDFANGMAKIQSITTESAPVMDVLAQGIRDVGDQFGFLQSESQAALYDIIRQSGSASGAVDIMKLSAEAARANFTDLGGATSAADVLMSGFKLTVNDLGGGFDILTAAQKSNGLTLAEFGAETGKAANLARAAGLDLAEFSAILTVLHQNGLTASDAVQTLTQLMTRFADPGVKAKLDDLGISSTNLATALGQMAERKIPITDIIDLGIAGTKSAAGIAALTRDGGALPEVLTKIQQSAGATTEALNAFQDSPLKRERERAAAWERLKTNLGEMFGVKSVFLDGLVLAEKGFNKLVDAGRKAEQSSDDLLGRYRIVGEQLSLLEKSAESGAEAGRKFWAAWQDAEAQKSATDIENRIASLRTAAENFAKTIEGAVAALQANATQQIAEVNTRAAAEIAALGKSAEALQNAADKKISIETDAVNKRFTLLTNAETKINEAIDTALKARAKLVADDDKAREKFDQDSVKTRLAAITPLLASWRAYYADLTTLAQDHAAKAKAFEDERYNNQTQAERELFNLRVSTLSSFDQYVAKVKEAERLVQLERDAAAQGDLKRAAEYRDQAIAVAKSITSAVSSSGVEIISQGQAQQSQIKVIKDARDVYNDTLTESAKREKAAADAFAGEAKGAKEKLEELQRTYDKLQESASKAIVVKVEADENSVRAVTAKLDELTRERTVSIKLSFNEEALRNLGSLGDLGLPGWGIPGVNSTPTGGYNRGGYVGNQTVQRFAAGGGVWKVPGSGDSDSVPAFLEKGSYVLRKSASQHFGPEFMEDLLGFRKFAVGGIAAKGFGSSEKASWFLSGAQGQKILGIGDWQPGEKNLYNIKVDAEQIVTELQGKMVGLPKPEIGQGFGAYLQQVLELVRKATTAADAAKLWDPIRKNLDSIVVAIAQAQLFHVPLVFGTKVDSWGPSWDDAGLWSLPRDENGSLIAAWPDAWAALQKTGAPKGYKPGPYRYSGGGDVGDIVPAMLTPGELVLNPPAVRALSPELLDAMNLGLVTKDRYHAVQRFANGGGVWKVPGFGNGDTTPAMLQEGSYVLRKSASQHFGLEFIADLLGFRKFAVGGIAAKGFGSSEKASWFLSGAQGQKILGIGDWQPGEKNLYNIKVDAEQIVTELQGKMVGLPKPEIGQGFGAYLQQVLELVRKATTAADATKLWDPIRKNLDSIVVAIAQAQLFHVPLVFGTKVDSWGPSWDDAGLWSLPRDKNGSLIAAWPDAWAALQNTQMPKGYKPGPFRFAGGGGVGTDTVPAMLTPGEFVLNPSAVRTAGVNLLDAMNMGRITKESFARMAFEPPRPMRFATGGYVPGAAPPASGSSKASGGISITVNAAGGDLSDPATVRRVLLPVMREIERRSR